MTDEKMERAFDEAYPKGKPSFNALRVDNLVAKIAGYQHQIKVLSDRHNKDVETIERLEKLSNHFSDTITAQQEEIDSLTVTNSGLYRDLHDATREQG